jgi:hypothetical protein
MVSVPSAENLLVVPLILNKIGFSFELLVFSIVMIVQN